MCITWHATWTLCAASAHEELAFEANGFLHCTFYRSDGAIFESQTLRFELLVSGEQHPSSYYPRGFSTPAKVRVFPDRRPARQWQFTRFWLLGGTNRLVDTYKD